MSAILWSSFLGGIASLIQMLVLLVIAPFFSWALEALPIMVSGRSTVSVWTVYGQCFASLRQGLRWGLPQEEGLCLVLVLVAFMALPGFSAMRVFGEAPSSSSLGNPLLVGGMLLLGAGCLMPVMVLGRVLGAVLALCLTETVLVLAAPGVNGVAGVHTLLHLAPGSGLAGASICCALSLAVASPLPTTSELTALMSEPHAIVQGRDRRDMRRVLLRFLRVGWLLLVADLLFPVLVGGTGWSGLLGLVIRLGCALLVMMLLRLTGVERYLRLGALLMGLGFLIALAGRFAT